MLCSATLETVRKIITCGRGVRSMADMSFSAFVRVVLALQPVFRICRCQFQGFCCCNSLMLVTSCQIKTDANKT